ncbi:SsgA family sporulation/cell division regulator [Alteromonas gracilis]
MKRTTARPVSVSERHRVHLVDDAGNRAELPVRFDYDPADPFAVSMTFLAVEEVTWTFARELLMAGIHEPTGEGDVHVWPCLSTEGHAVVIVELSSPDGAVLVQIAVKDATRFIRRTTDSVAFGTESAHLDLDATVEALLTADPDVLR